MTTPRRIREQLETELRRVEERLRQIETPPMPLEWPAPGSEGAHTADFYDLVQASEAKEMAYETRNRLVRRLTGLREAIRRLREGSYGRCADCGGLIPERRLLAVPEATLCAPCQERRERVSGGHHLRRSSLQVFSD